MCAQTISSLSPMTADWLQFGHARTLLQHYPVDTLGPQNI